MVYGLNTRRGCFGEFSALHRKMSVLWVCNMVSLKQTSENVCSLDVSASSVLRCSVCSYCPSGTSEYVFGLIQQVIYSTDIVKYLITCIQVYFTLFLYDDLVSNSQTSENVWDLAQAAFPTETNVFCLAYTHMCSIHWFLSAVQLRNQHLPFSNLDRWKTM